MTVEGPHITRTDMVAALQLVRDMAAQELPAAHWADVDAAVNTIADALARDYPEELSDTP
ncbi:hypothetical protein ACFTZF_24260 [Streptomyces mirabilis]|uniref:hypothetical protein n=1 Tax=Streptomyces mirabilis TaxID=68239 RepID=UPI003629FD5A